MHASIVEVSPILIVEVSPIIILLWKLVLLVKSTNFHNKVDNKLTESTICK